MSTTILTIESRINALHLLGSQGIPLRQTLETHPAKSIWTASTESENLVLVALFQTPDELNTLALIKPMLALFPNQTAISIAYVTNRQPGQDEPNKAP